MNKEQKEAISETLKDLAEAISVDDKNFWIGCAIRDLSKVITND